MMRECFCCGKEVEVSADACPACRSGHTRSGHADIFWNGMLARRLEVGWCHACDAAWILRENGNRSPICDDCRARALRVDLPQIVEAAAA